MIKISVFKDEAEVSRAAAELVVSISQKAIERDGIFTIALSGGNTPSQLYELLASKPYNKEIKWKQTFIFWGDERMVAANNKQNNSYQAKKIFLDNIPIPAENIFTVPVSQPPAKAANNYGQTLKAFFHSELPAFDLVLLGMGEDGHTASLFPGTPILNETEALVKEVYSEGQDIHRVSFTLPLINNARHILFLVTGSQKAAMAFKVLEGTAAKKYPAKLIKGNKKSKIYWYLDKDAASLIN